MGVTVELQNLGDAKADRMVTRFVADALGVQSVTQELAESLVREASTVLRPEFPKLVPSVLDNTIWKYQRDRDELTTRGCRPNA